MGSLCLSRCAPGNPDVTGCSIIFWFSLGHPSLAASSETLECEGPFSTEQSSCHTEEEEEEEEDVTHSSDADFQVKGYKFSKPFHLIVSYDWLILQGPATSIFEGDPLVLHCRAWQDWPLTRVIFYRDSSALGPPGSEREFSIDVVQRSDSGQYHCSGIFRSPGPGSRETASPVAITVQELFPSPVLKALPSNEPQEGGSVTLSCQTKLSLQRSASRLLFSFYKDGRSLSIRGVSSELQIPKVSEEHSGFYWCEAATEDRQVWKQSPQLEIQVQVPYRGQAGKSSASPIQVLGERVTLRCDGYHPLLLELRPISTLWYLGHVLLPSHKKSIEVQTPGVYRCQTRGAPVSDPIHLSVSNDWLILQVPYAAVFEGEPLVMRCRGWYDKVVYKLHYYHDGQAVRYFHSSTNYTVLQARASDSGHYQCSGTMRIPVESAPMFSSKVAVTVQELFQTPVLRTLSPQETRGRVVLRCETRLHPQKRDTPLQFAFYKYSRPVRRFDWVAEYTVPEPEIEELESYWCEAATTTRSVRKRSPWLQLPGRGSAPDLASTTAPVPQAAALAPGNKPLSFRKTPVSRSVSSVTSVPNSTFAGLQFPADHVPTAGPHICAPLPTSEEQSREALQPKVDLLLREMRLLKGLLSRVVLGLKDPQAFREFTETPETPNPHVSVSPGTPETTVMEGRVDS
ncbi:hypothetical protein STEG23_020450 [Scotinomys teguina]